MTPLLWTAPALDDLRRISLWLAEHASKEIALEILAKIGDRATFLSRFPRGGRPVHAHPFRVLRVLGTPYLILYRIGDEEIELLRIRHEREDWQGEA